MNEEIYNREFRRYWTDKSNHDKSSSGLHQQRKIFYVATIFLVHLFNLIFN